MFFRWFCNANDTSANATPTDAITLAAMVNRSNSIPRNVNSNPIMMMEINPSSFWVLCRSAILRDMENFTVVNTTVEIMIDVIA